MNTQNNNANVHSHLSRSGDQTLKKSGPAGGESGTKTECSRVGIGWTSLLGFLFCEIGVPRILFWGMLSALLMSLFFR